MTEGPQARAFRSLSSGCGLVAATAAAGAPPTRIDDQEDDGNDDRKCDRRQHQPACPAPAAAPLCLFFTECGHEPLLSAPVESNIPSRIASPLGARRKRDPRHLR